MADADSITRLNAALEGRYRIERELGSGGMATVYLAEDLKHGRQVAVKVLRPEVAEALGPERFLREIETVARLTHPHILPLHDSGEADGLLFYVMPYVEGETLRERLEREGALPIDDALRIARECAEALEHAHGQGIIHRDLKPANILFSGGHAVVADFGIARAVEDAADEQALTRTGVSIGTVGYMSPEQATGERTVDERTDVYALGCVLYEMLTGERAFTGRTAQAVMARQLTGEVPSVRVLRPSVSEELDQVVKRALQPNPADRYGTVGEVRKALQRPDKPSSLWRAIRAAPLRWPVTVAIGTIVLFGLLLALPDGPGDDMPRSGSSEVIELSDHRVAVFPFQVQASEELAYLGEGLMTAMSGALDGLGELRSADPYAVMDRLGTDRATSSVDLAEAREIAESLGAGRFILGTLTELGSDLRVDASLYSTLEAARPSARATVEGGTSQISDLVAELTRKILGQIPLGTGPRLSEVDVVEPANYEAFAAYVEGEALMRRGDFVTAGERFEEAVQADSTFALAWYRLSIAQGWGASASGSRSESIQAAMRYRDALPRRDRLLVEELHAFHFGDGRTAERLARRIVGSYPGHMEGWYHLAQARMVYIWQQGSSWEQVGDALDRALSLDPGYQPALVYASLLASQERRYDDLQGILRRLNVESGGAAGAHLSYRAGIAFATGDSVSRSRIVGEALAASDFALWNAGLHLAATTDSLAAAGRLWRALAEGGARSEEYQVIARFDLGFLEVARGRWGEAVEHFERASQRSPLLARAFRGWLATVPWSERPPGELGQLSDSVDQWPFEATDREQLPSNSGVRIPAEILPGVETYLSGLLSARIGERERALSYAAALEAAETPPDRHGLREDLALEIRALIALDEGRPEDVLRMVERSRGDVAIWNDVFTLLYRRPLTRVLRVEALLQLGRLEEALTWLKTFESAGWGAEYFLQTPSFLRQAQIYERLGDRAQATEYYERFVARWEEADPQYQPSVDAARRRLEALRADSEGG